MEFKKYIALTDSLHGIFYSDMRAINKSSRIIINIKAGDCIEYGYGEDKDNLTILKHKNFEIHSDFIMINEEELKKYFKLVE